ncbi:long tail fiber distal subunit [Acinetobacter phage Stupor]|nr:long tail fiber distal subunit [Acinetobacter phage Stupor]
MALDSNISRIKFMRSKTAGAVPSPTLLDEGELAINLVDRTIFSKNGANTVELGFGKGGTVAGPINVTGGNAVTAAQFNGALNGNAATASRLLTGRKINDVVFDGTKDITIEDSTKLYKSDVLTSTGSSRVIRDAATIRAATVAKGAVVIHLPKRANSVNTMMKLCIQGFDYVAGRATQSNWSVDISGYNYTGAAWHSYQAISTGGPAPFDTVRWGQAGDHQVIILGEGGASPSSWSYYNISIEKIYLTNSTEAYDDPNDPIYMAIEADISNYVINATLPLEGVAMAKRLETGRTFTFTGDARGSLTFDGTANVSTALTINSATTGQAGLVKLNNTLTSTSLTEALTANMGKILGDAVNTKVDKINPTSSGTLTHTGAASTSGLLNATGGISTSSLAISTGSISKTDGTGYLSFLQGGAALGINIGDLLVSNSYSDRSKIPINGAYLKGGLDADNVIRGATGTAYSSLTAIGVGISIPFKLKDTNIGTSYGFVPGFGMNVQTSGGYRQVVSIGAYRPGSNWTDSGVYIATGATNDGYSSEAFLLKSGRTISNTAGPINLIGNADTASNIDASTGSLVGDSSAGWRKLGRATVPQNGRALMLQIFGGTGFNAGVPTQAMCTEIVLKGGNSGPSSINMVVHVPDSSNILANLGKGVANACFVPVTGDDYDIYINCVGYLRAGIVAIKGALTDWALNFDVAGVSTKPTGAVDAAIYTKAYTTSNVASATKLQNPRTINGVNFDGTANIKIQQESVAIPANANLTNYTNEGFYVCEANATAVTIKGTPFNPSGTSSSALAFSLLVEKSAGVKQTYTSYASGATRTWVRGIYQGSPSAWREVAFCNSPTFVDTTTFNGPIVASSTLNVTGTAGFNSVSVNNLSASTTISAGTSLGIANTVATTKYGLSLYGGASAGKPSYGVLFTGTSNSDTGKHGDVNGQWSVYFTCATSGSEKRGWVFQRSSGGAGGAQNVASISTDGNMVINGNFDTASDNTMIRVGNNNDLAMIKKAGSSAFIAVGSNTAFRVLKSPIATVDPTQSYVNLMTVTTSGDLDLAGNNILIGSGTNNNTYQTIQFGNYTKSSSGGGFSVLQTAPVGGSQGRVLQLANYTQAGTIDSALHVNNSGTYQTVGSTTLKLATISDNVASATKLQTARTFQITGGITTNAVSFDGQQNVVLTASNVDGSKVSGVVPEAVKAQTLAVTPQKNAKLVASWKGTILQSMTPTLTIVDANTLRVRLADDNPGNRLAVLRFNVKIGTVYHLAFSDTMLPINGTVTFVQTGLTWVEVDLNAPNHGLSGSGLGVNVMAITYSAYGCYFEGTISQIIGTTGPQDSQWAYVLKLNSPTTDATYNLSGSSQDAIWVADKNIWYLNPAQPVITAGAMISPDRLNFFAADTDSSARMRSNMVTAQIWDIV